MEINEIIDYLVKKYNCIKGKEYDIYIAMYYKTERFDIYTLIKYLTYKTVLIKVNTKSDVDTFISKVEKEITKNDRKDATRI